MPQALTTPNTYPTLVKKVSQELSELEFFIKRRPAEGYWKIGKYIYSIRCHGLCPWFDAVLARGHATGKWRPEGSSLDDHLWANEKSRTTIKEG